MPVTTLVSYSIERVSVLDEAGRLDASLMPDLSPEQIQALYSHMVLTRRFDERMFNLQRQGRLGTFARVAGQEAAHVGAAFALQSEDWYVPAFRETGALLLRGWSMAKVLQYWSGDERGADLPSRFRTLPISIPVGTQMTHAVGIGWAMGQSGEKSAVLTIFGEGATSEGDFSEAMNMAGVFQTPVVFFCQNNQYAISVPYSRQTAAPSVAQKALAFGMTGVQIDGNDVFAAYRVTKEALERARAGLGPTLIEAQTYRVTDHTTSDDARRYRSEEEVETWKKRDPIRRVELYLKSAGLLDDDRISAVSAEADAQIEAAVQEFEAVESPAANEIFEHVYAELTPALVEQKREALARPRGGE